MGGAGDRAGSPRNLFWLSLNTAAVLKSDEERPIPVVTGEGRSFFIKDMDREKFSYALNRDTFLTGLGWKMLHFSFDDIQQRPEVCRMLLQLVLAPYLARPAAAQDILSEEKEVLRFAWRIGNPLRPKDVCDHFAINFRTAKRLLQSLCEKGLLKPVVASERTRYYELKAMRSDQIW